MSAITTIERALNTELFLADLTIIPDCGATLAEIADEEFLLGRRISSQHRQLLERWNGIGLEVIRFFGCGNTTGEVGRLSDFQVDFDFAIEGAIIIASDAAGFAYLEAKDGPVYSFDTDGGDVKELANNIDDFVDRVIFGLDAAQFAGEDWFAEIRKNRLV